MQFKTTILIRVACSELIVSILLISSCLAVVRSQMINSYPLAIEFESYAGTPTIAQPLVSYTWQQVQTHRTQTGNPGAQVNQTKTMSSVNYQKKSQMLSSITQQNSAHTIVPTTSNALTETQLRSNYQKRTLSPDRPNVASLSISTDGNDKDMKQDDAGTPKTNTSDILDVRKLVLLRQKMIDMQGRINVSIEDTNWKIAAGCLSNQSGNQFIRNKDVKCASSQVVLSISRMQRAGCKQCEPYFHCEGFSNALKRCKDNYDVQDTLNVMRSCQGLIGSEIESVEATRAPSQGADCQRYLCGWNCNYNPTDGTCPRNNCYSARSDDNTSQYKYYLRSRRGRPTNLAYPAESPIKNKIVDRKN